jgi:hypothetical protein
MWSSFRVWQGWRISSGVQYVILHTHSKKLDEEIPTNAGWTQRKWFWLSIRAPRVAVVLVTRLSSAAVHLKKKKSVINWI